MIPFGNRLVSVFAGKAEAGHWRSGPFEGSGSDQLGERAGGLPLEAAPPGKEAARPRLGTSAFLPELAPNRTAALATIQRFDGGGAS